MSNSLFSRLRPLALAAGAACAAGVALWLARRESQPALLPPPPVESERFAAIEEEALESPPDSFTFEPEPASIRVSAQPAERGAAYHLLEDYGALSPEELGSAFLAGATDTAVDEPPNSTAELSGFQIFDHRVPEYQSDEAIDDEELAAIFARRA